MTNSTMNGSKTPVEAALNQFEEERSKLPAPPDLKGLKAQLWAAGIAVFVAATGAGVLMYFGMFLWGAVGLGLLGAALVVTIWCVHSTLVKFEKFGQAVRSYADDRFHKETALDERLLTLRADLSGAEADASWSTQKHEVLLPAVRRHDERLDGIEELLRTIRKALGRITSRKPATSDTVAKRLSSALKKVLDELHLQDLTEGWTDRKVYEEDLDEMDREFEEFGIKPVE